MRRLCVLTMASILAAGSIPAYAASNPVINVVTYGVELCPQSICGAAIFVGVLQGQVGNNFNAFGTFAVAITHEDLPAPGHTAAITGGAFEFRIGLRRIKGVITGGSLFNNGDNTYSVSADLLITSGGSGTLSYLGLLSHNTFPPTVIGTVTQ